MQKIIIIKEWHGITLENITVKQYYIGSIITRPYNIKDTVPH
jgi:hypothetical protein